jgi:hypothetical protein
VNIFRTTSFDDRIILTNLRKSPITHKYFFVSTRKSPKTVPSTFKAPTLHPSPDGQYYFEIDQDIKHEQRLLKDGSSVLESKQKYVVRHTKTLKVVRRGEIYFGRGIRGNHFIQAKVLWSSDSKEFWVSFPYVENVGVIMLNIRFTCMSKDSASP